VDRALGAALKGYRGVGGGLHTRRGRDHVTGMENIQDDPYREGNGDPHDEVVRLEALIEELTAKIESCRKFILASRFVTWGGGVVLFAMLFGVMRFDLGIMAGIPPFHPTLLYLPFEISCPCAKGMSQKIAHVSRPSPRD
jgi:hypothetical protein